MVVKLYKFLVRHVIEYGNYICMGPYHTTDQKLILQRHVTKLISSTSHYTYPARL